LTKGGQVAWELHSPALGPGQQYCDGVLPCVAWSRFPVDMTSREDGEHYAAWLARSGRLPGARLCADREWERAARGADSRLYPSGNGDLGPNDACTRATYAGGVTRIGPCPVGTHGASRSPFGVEDMIGNVWEWTAGPADIAHPGQGVGRGAGWSSSGSVLLISNRGIFGTKIRYFGLRVCADAR
jgi:formylglycine-generating enzyme required for sulfatase activity